MPPANAKLSPGESKFSDLDIVGTVQQNTTKSRSLAETSEFSYRWQYEPRVNEPS